MKNLISAALITGTILTGNQVLAQDNLSIGGTAGFGHTWLSDADNSKYQPAGNLGLTLTYSTQSNWGFGADLKWSIEGGKSSTGNTTNTTRLDYMRIPLRAIYFFGDRGNALRPKIFAGPSFGLLIGGKNEATTNIGGANVTVETKAKDFAKSFDVGIGAGVGFNYRLVDRTWLNADIGYYHGLIDVIEDPNIEQRNRNIGINVGITVGIGQVR
ncbi:MAG TPA: porin family protein [Flavihumibacter sp.]